VGAILFLMFLGVLGFIFLVVVVLSLLFGGEDPYERELRAYDRNDELCDSIRSTKRGKSTHYHITDGRSVHLHEHHK